MAVGANSYGTKDRVQHLIRDTIEGGAFSGSTVPSNSQVETWIDDVSDEANHALRANNYDVPVANSGSDVEAFGLMTKAVVAETAAIVLNMFPGAAWDPEDPEPLRNRIGFLHWQFTNVINMINEQKFAASKSTAKLGRLWSGAEQDGTGNTKAPFFTRTLTDYPASRSTTTS